MSPSQLYNLRRLSTTMIPQNFLMQDDAIEYEGIEESAIPGMVFINGVGPQPDPRPNIQRKEPEPEPERNLPVLQPQLPILQPRPIMTGEPMYLAFRLLKELYLEPMSEGADYDGLKRDLKNFSGSYNIKTDGESMKLENVASDDKDMVKRIAESYGHSATNEPKALGEVQETSYPQFHSGYLG